MLSTSDIAARLRAARERLQPGADSESGPPASSDGGTPPPDQARSGVKRLRDGSRAGSSGPEDGSEDPGLPDGSTPPRKGSAHLPGSDRQTYSRADVPQHTTTHNKTAQPHDVRGCRAVDAFRKLNLINEGTFGRVWRAYDAATKRVMALKQVKMEHEKEGFPLSALREIDVLMSLSHENIVAVTEIVVGGSSSVFLVMEYVEHDLRFLAKVMGHRWSTSEAKCLTVQLLGAVAFMHANWVVHRDLKTANLLYNNRGVLKVCDFGLARLVGQSAALTPGTCTLWYRAPEVLMGSRQYGPACDCWAVGVIAAEFVTGEPVASGRGDAEQASMLFDLFGLPTQATWPGFSSLPAVAKDKVPLKGPSSSRFASLFNVPREDGEQEEGADASKPALSRRGLDFMERLLVMDPQQRCSAERALEHPYLAEAPLPQDRALMPSFPATNDRPRAVAQRELDDQPK